MGKRFFALAYLAVCVLWLNIGNEFLASPDAPLHAYLGKMIASQPLREWVVMRWSPSGPLFIDHPQLMPWLVALSVKLFGVSTLSAILPAVICSTATVLVVYGIGRLVLGETFGLVAATLLVFTPRFVRHGRNPMLEPLLSLTVFSAVYFGLKGMIEKRVLPFLAAGFALGLAFMTKGPPSLLAPAILGSFYWFEKLAHRGESRFALSPRQLLAGTALLLVTPALMILAVDLWHRGVTGESFYGQFLSFLYHQGTDHAPSRNREPFFYVDVVRHSFWPWWPLCVVAPIVGLLSRGRLARSATLLASLGFYGTVLGFSLIRWRNDWYIDLSLPAFALLAAVPVWLCLRPDWIERHYARAAFGLALAVVTLCAICPPWFEMPRPPFSFISRARAELGESLANGRIADCVPFQEWPGPYLFSYYLGATRVGCGEPAAYAMIPADRLQPGQKILVASDQLLLVKTGQ